MPVAGIGVMRYPRFVAHNVLGGFLWGFGVSLGGYFFGRFLPPEQVDRYLLPAIAVIVAV